MGQGGEGWQNEEFDRSLNATGMPGYELRNLRADHSIGQIYARELDEDRDWCSVSSMYRIARAAGQSRERRRQATHPPKVKPQLLADGPTQVWTWAITKLRGPGKGIFYQLDVLIDIFSRFNPSWMINPVEDSLLAADFIEEAIERNGVVPHTVHADRGTSMTSKPVPALLADLGVTRSHSRPHVSDANPLSEAQFKTLKYLPNFPAPFGSLADAREFCAGFFHEYNFIHRHSGRAMPRSVTMSPPTKASSTRPAVDRDPDAPAVANSTTCVGVSAPLPCSRPTR